MALTADGAHLSSSWGSSRLRRLSNVGASMPIHAGDRDVGKKIGFFLPDLGGGGVARTRLNLIQGLLDRGGVEIDLLLCAGRGLRMKEVPADVGIIDLGTARVRALIPLLVRYLRESRPDVLFVSKEHHALCALAARAWTGVHTRIFPTFHGTYSDRLRENRTTLDRVWLPPAVSLLLPRADRIIAVSHGVARDLSEVARIPRDRILVLNNPTQLDDIESMWDEPVDHRFFAPGEPPVVLGAGGLTKQKDFPTLIRAFAEMRRVRPCRLLILGEGRDRAMLEGLVKSLGLEADVDLPGYEPNPFRYMSRAGVFALSSLWEGFPGVLVQALYCGAAVVSTRYPTDGPEEILDHEKFGCVVPMGDPLAMARALLEALDESPDVAAAREHCRKFDIPVITQRYVDELGL